MDIIAYQVLCGLLALICVLGAWWSIRKFDAGSSRTPSHPVVLLWILPAAIAVVSACWLALETLGPGVFRYSLMDAPGTMYFDREAHLIAQLPEGTVIQRSQRPPGTALGLHPGSQIHWQWEVPMSVSPITPNPKVRELHYEIEVGVGLNTPEIGNFIRYFDVSVSQDLDMPAQREAVIKHVRFFLYEFNERHSKELAAFYNPLDKGQQKEFAALVRTYLEPELARSGLTIESVRFSLP